MNEQSLSHFPLNSDIWIKDVDDWIGVTDSRQRKKIQNRRNHGHSVRRPTRNSTRTNYGTGAKKRGVSQNAKGEDHYC